MTSAIPFPAAVIGLMSGTSADGVDAALIETDGREQVKPIASVSIPYDDALRAAILGLMQGKGNEKAVTRSLTEIHAQAIGAVIANSGMLRNKIKLIGFHGQTIHHAPERGVTQQIGDAAWLAKKTGIAVVADFRSNDIKHGGQGAPLVPLYHAALARNLSKPLMIVNIGGVSNITWIAARSEGGASPPFASLTPSKGSASGLRDVSSNLLIQAFDCGPGNALIDDWVHAHTGARCDEGGEIASRGKVKQSVVDAFLAHPFFTGNSLRALDRNTFSRDAVTGLSLEDGAATLTAMTAAAIAFATTRVRQMPKRLLITGGGRHNPTLMKMIAGYAQCDVAPVETVGWNGDMLEAEAFAYLAARSVQGLPLSLPETTGVAQPVTGGVFYPAAGAGAI